MKRSRTDEESHVHSENNLIVQKLESKCKYLYEKVNKLQSEITDKEFEMREVKEVLESKLENSEDTLRVCELEFSELEANKDVLNSKYIRLQHQSDQSKATILEMENQLKSLYAKHGDMNQLESTIRSLEQHKEILDQESKLIQSKINSNSVLTQYSDADFQTLRAGFDRKERLYQSRIQELEKQNSKLHTDNEKNIQLATKMKRLEDEMKKAGNDMMEFEIMKNTFTSFATELKSLTKVITDTVDSSMGNGGSIARILSEHRHQDNSNRDETSWFTTLSIKLIQAFINDRPLVLQQTGELKARVGSMELNLKSTNDELALLKDTMIKKELSLSRLTSTSNDLESRVVYLKNQNDSLKSLLATFEKEYSLDSVNEIRIGELKKLNDEQNTQDKHRMQELESRMVDFNTMKVDFNSLQSQVKVLLEKNKELESDLEKTLEREAELSSRLGRGEFDKSTTKVLHMSFNPSNQFKGPEREIENLKGEIVKLKQRLKDNSGTIDTASAPTSGTVNYKTVNKRLVEFFKKKTSAYREAVYLLLGYKMNMKDDLSEFTLKSMYAKHEGDCLKFKLSGDKTLSLLETDFGNNLDSKVYAYLTMCNSFPAFLAALTLELFEDQTMLG